MSLLSDGGIDAPSIRFIYLLASNSFEFMIPDYLPWSISYPRARFITMNSCFRHARKSTLVETSFFTHVVKEICLKEICSIPVSRFYDKTVNTIEPHYNSRHRLPTPRQATSRIRPPEEHPPRELGHRRDGPGGQSGPGGVQVEADRVHTRQGLSSYEEEHRDAESYGEE